ncbi:MAG TPA: hypothetical protein VK589_15125 [Chryseolinea sp.]|nr:hypothetical protein [Chryseolinea sp.]
MPTDESLVRLSGDNIIELVRERRSDLISKLLHDDELNLYVKETFNISEVSLIKREFIKRALKELNLTPIDLSHYGQIILEMRKSGSLVVSSNNEKLFYQEIENSIKNYLL